MHGQLHTGLLIILYLEPKRLRDDATKKSTENEVVASIISDSERRICFAWRMVVFEITFF